MQNQLSSDGNFVILKCFFLFVGAQSDSEVNSVAGASDNVSDRGYTSDGELYDSTSRPSDRSDSWLLVRSVPLYVLEQEQRNE